MERPLNHKSNADAPATRFVHWSEIKVRLADSGVDRARERVYGVPRNGMVIASLLRHADVVTEPESATVFLDDLVDSGRTRDNYHRKYPGTPFRALYDKKNGDGKDWIVFPWETESGPEDVVVRLLTYLGEDPNREGLLETPSRYIRAMVEMTAGYRQDPQAILSKVFNEPYDEMIVVGPVPFTSMCEHHVLPFSGEAWLGYIPKGKVVGLSKLPRLVQCFAKRLQIQERMTQEIVHEINAALDPLGAACVIRAQHLCMKIRGVKSDGGMTTSCLTGMFKTDLNTRGEFLRFAQCR
jgi:GTP cyclohydrolase I